MKIKLYILAMLMPMLALGFASCDDVFESPQISGIWSNSSKQVNHQIECAYPGDIIRVEGYNLDNARKLFVNGTEVNVMTNTIYNNASAITFRVPNDVRLTTSHDPIGYIRLITAGGEAVWRNFLFKETSARPTITRFSSTTLIPGNKLVIYGTNLDGVERVYLPTVFDGKIEAEISADTQLKPTEITVIIPDGKFAKGWCEIEMRKPFAEDSESTYTEWVFSNVTNFTN